MKEPCDWNSQRLCKTFYRRQLDIGLGSFQFANAVGAEPGEIAELFLTEATFDSPTLEHFAELEQDRLGHPGYRKAKT